MKDDAGPSACQSFRTLFEKLEFADSLTEQENLAYEQHFANCSACSSWSKQHSAILELSAAMPQFDVSEGLTQRIISSLEKSSTPAVETSLLPLCLLAVLAFLVLVPFDSLQGICVWGLGVLGLILFQALIQAANTQERLI